MSSVGFTGVNHFGHFLFGQIGSLPAEAGQEAASSVAQEGLQKPDRQEHRYNSEPDPVFGRKQNPQCAAEYPAQLQNRLGSTESGRDRFLGQVVLE